MKECTNQIEARVDSRKLLDYLSYIINIKQIKYTDLASQTGISKQNLSRIFLGIDIKVSQLFLILKEIDFPLIDFFDGFTQSNLKNKIVEMDQNITELNNRYLLSVANVKKHEEKITHLIVLNKNLNIMVDALKKALESSKRIESHSEVMLKQQERMIKQLETIAIMKDFFNTVPKPDQNESNDQK